MMSALPDSVHVVNSESWHPSFASDDLLLWQGDVEGLVQKLPAIPIFDLVVTSPPYNLGKAYEEKRALKDYLDWQERIITRIVREHATLGGCRCHGANTRGHQSEPRWQIYTT